MATKKVPTAYSYHIAFNARNEDGVFKYGRAQVERKVPITNGKQLSEIEAELELRYLEVSVIIVSNFCLMEIR